MAKTDQVLVLDIGSTGVRVCEFDFPAGGGFILLGYMQVEYTEQLTEENRSLIIGAGRGWFHDHPHFRLRKRPGRLHAFREVAAGDRGGVASPPDR